MKRERWIKAALVLGFAISAGNRAWANDRCALPKGKGAIALVEANLAILDKGLPARSTVIRGLRSELQTLSQRGDAFSGKAAPVEAECLNLAAELARLKAAYDSLERSRQPLRDRIASLRRTWDQTILPRSRSLDSEAAQYKAAGCGRTFNMKTEAAAYHRCEAWRVQLQGRIDAHKAEARRIQNEWSGLSDRIRAMGEGYRRASDAYRARYAKYRTTLGAYRAERAAWDGLVRQVGASAYGLMAELGRKSPATERRAAIQLLRGQVAGIQAALRRLNRSMLTDARERAAWEKATDDAMNNAWDRGKGMIVDEGLGLLGRRLEARLASANQEIQRAVTLLSGERDPARRERLHAAIKLLGKQRDEVKAAERVVVNRLADAKKVVDAVDYGTSNPGDLEKSLKGAFSIVTTTLGDPSVQRALKVGGGYAAGAGYAQSIAESSLDITTEIVAWRRIKQLNANSDAYLQAVNRLKDKMEKTVRKIETIEKSKQRALMP